MRRRVGHSFENLLSLREHVGIHQMPRSALYPELYFPIGMPIKGLLSTAEYGPGPGSVEPVTAREYFGVQRGA